MREVFLDDALAGGAGAHVRGRGGRIGTDAGYVNEPLHAAARRAAGHNARTVDVHRLERLGAVLHVKADRVDGGPCAIECRLDGRLVPDVHADRRE